MKGSRGGGWCLSLHYTVFLAILWFFLPSFVIFCQNFCFSWDSFEEILIYLESFVEISTPPIPPTKIIWQNLHFPPIFWWKITLLCNLDKKVFKKIYNDLQSTIQEILQLVALLLKIFTICISAEIQFSCS